MDTIIRELGRNLVLLDDPTSFDFKVFDSRATINGKTKFFRSVAKCPGHITPPRTMADYRVARTAFIEDSLSLCKCLSPV